MFRSVVVFVFLLFVISLFGAVVEVDSADYGGFLELGTANDLFQARVHSDKYYSASFRASYMHPFFDNKVARSVLLGDSGGNNFFGLVVRQTGFTPEDLTESEIIFDDRPYAGTLTMQYWRVSKKQLDWEFTSALKLGVVGPAAMVEQVQTNIHNRTGGTPPKGWDNQIANALVLDYFTQGERRFLPSYKRLMLSVGGYGEVGSLINIAGAYSKIRVGKYNENPRAILGLNYNKYSKSPQWQVYAEFIFGGRYVFYDATLQGGLLPFNDSPHTFSSDDYKHFTSNFTYRLTVSYQNLMLIYSSSVEVDRYFTDGYFSFGAFNLIIPIGAR